MGLGETGGGGHFDPAWKWIADDFSGYVLCSVAWQLLRITLRKSSNFKIAYIKWKKIFNIFN